MLLSSNFFNFLFALPLHNLTFWVPLPLYYVLNGITLSTLAPFDVAFYDNAHRDHFM